MLEFYSLINKKIAMLWSDANKEDSGESVLMRYYGTVECIKDKRGRDDNKSCVAAIKWEGGVMLLTENLKATHGRALRTHLGCGQGRRLSKQQQSVAKHY